MSGVLLIPEPALQVLPRLAKRIGLKEAIALQQLYFWTVTKARRRQDFDGWVYNTFEQWREQFPFWSEDTIKRTWASLKKQGFIAIQQRRGSDRTNSYRVVYENLPGVQNPLANRADCPLPDGGRLPSSLEQAETNQRDTSANADAGTVIDLFEFWSTQLKKRNPKLSEKRKKAIRARLKEGFTIEEIQAAIVGLTFSDHHMGRNGSPTKYDDLELICRNPENVEKFRDLYRERKGAAGDDDAAFDEFLGGKATA